MTLESCINGTHEFAYDNEGGGPFTYSAADPNSGEALSWTSGTGKLWHLEDDGATGYMVIGLLTGTAPGDGDTITGGASGATCDVDGSVSNPAAMADGEDLAIESGAVITCTESPTILLGEINLEFGELFLDGVNISAGNLINFVGEYAQVINVNGNGLLTANGAWVQVGTTDASDDQSVDLSAYWGGQFEDVIPMVRIETGRRIYYDGSSGEIPIIGDHIYKASDNTITGEIVEVNTSSSYLVVRYLTGTLADNEAFNVQKVVDVDGPLMSTSWTALVDNILGDIKEDGIYQSFGNSRHNSISYIANFSHGIGGFVFDHEYQTNTLTLGTTVGTLGGFVPPTGCKIEAPNVHISTSNTTQYALGNTYHDGTDGDGGWYNVITTDAGSVDFKILNLGIALAQLINVYDSVFEDVGFALYLGASNSPNPVTYLRCVGVQDPVNTAIQSNLYQYYAFGYAANPGGVTIQNCLIIKSDTNGGQALGGEGVSGLTITGNITSTAYQAWVPSGLYNAIRIAQCSDVVVDNNIVIMPSGAYGVIISVFVEIARDLSITGTLFATQDNQLIGAENHFFHFEDACSNVLISGFTFIGSAMIGDNFIYVTSIDGLKVRGIGQIDNKVNFGADGEYLLEMGPSCRNVSVARCWKEGGYPLVETFADTYNVEVLNCSQEYDGPISPSGLDNVLFAGVHGASDTPGSGIAYDYTAKYGRQVHDFFKSDTRGMIAWLAIAPSESINNVTIVNGNPIFTKTGFLNMLDGDILDVEQDYYSLGHVAFTGQYTATEWLSGWYADEWDDIDVDFQYNLGEGWNGSWLDARTVANWVAISGSHEFDVDNVSGTFNVGDDLSWGTGGTAGTGLVSAVTGTHLDLILISGVVPVNDMEITDDDTAATCDVNGSVSSSSVMVDGVKLKYRFTATADQDTLNMFIIDTTTTLTDQEANLHPIDQDEVDLTVTVVDRNQDPIENVQVAIHKQSDNTELMNEDTTALGVATEVFIYSTDEDILVKCRKAETADSPKYKFYSTTGTISSNGFTLLVTLEESTVLN